MKTTSKKSPAPKAGTKAPAPISAEEFDRKFEAGEDITEHLDLSRAQMVMPDTTAQKVNVDFPAWVVTALDQEADRIGVPRQSLIKVWIVERLENETAKRRAA